MRRRKIVVSKSVAKILAQMSRKNKLWDIGDRLSDADSDEEWHGNNKSKDDSKGDSPNGGGGPPPDMPSPDIPVTMPASTPTTPETTPTATPTTTPITTPRTPTAPAKSRTTARRKELPSYRAEDEPKSTITGTLDEPATTDSTATTTTTTTTTSDADVMQKVDKIESEAKAATDFDRSRTIIELIERDHIDFPTAAAYFAVQNIEKRKIGEKTRVTRAEAKYDSAKSQFVIGDAHIDKKDLADGRLVLHIADKPPIVVEDVSPLLLGMLFIPFEELKKVKRGSKLIFSEIERIKKIHTTPDKLAAKIESQREQTTTATGRNKPIATKLLNSLSSDMKLLSDSALADAVIQYTRILNASGVLQKKSTGKPPGKFTFIKKYVPEIKAAATKMSPSKGNASTSRPKSRADSTPDISARLRDLTNEELERLLQELDAI